MEIVHVAMVTLLCVSAIVANRQGDSGSDCSCGCGPKISIRTAAKREIEEKPQRHSVVDYCRPDYLMGVGQCLTFYKEGKLSGDKVKEGCGSLGGYGVTFYFRDQVRRFVTAFKMIHPGMEEIWTAGYWNGANYVWLGTDRTFEMDDFDWVDGASIADGKCTSVDIVAGKLRPRPCSGYDLDVACESDVTL